MDNFSASNFLPIINRSGYANRDGQSNVYSIRSDTDGSRYHLYDVSPIDNQPNNYLPGNQTTVDGNDSVQPQPSGRRRRASRQNRQNILIPGGQRSPEQNCLTALPLEQSNPVFVVNNSPQYSCHLNGEHKIFISIDALLAEQRLLRNFRDYAELYNVSSDIPATDADLKGCIKNRQEWLNAFFLINDIETISTANAEYSVNGGEASDVRPIATIHNYRMEDVNKRLTSIVLHGASKSVEFLRNYPNDNKNAFHLSDAGFYLSLNEKKLFCFSCGGSIEEWQEEWGESTLNEVHAKLYPNCSYLREKEGMEFIEARQQQLTRQQQRRLAQPLARHPHLYCSPVSDHQWQQENDVRYDQKVRCDLREGRLRVDETTLPGYLLEGGGGTHPDARNQGRQIQHQPGISSTIASNIQRCLRELHSSFLPGSPLHHAMDRLHGKVTTARDENNQLQLSLLQIVQSLMTLPEDQWADTGAEIAGIIDAAYDQDCQDHTSEIIDQIKTRMAFINIKRELEAGSEVVQISNLLKKLKLFYNESVLYNVMSSTRTRDGTLLVATRESTEIRGYIKNQFSRSICQFPENHVLQRYEDIGRQSQEVMAELKRKFTSGIMNKADFYNYIIDTFKSEPELLDLLRTRNAEFAVWHSKTESNTELLMEQYSPGMPGLAEQEIVEGAANVVDSRTRFMDDDLQQFVSEKLDLFWDDIIQETSR